MGSRVRVATAVVLVTGALGVVTAAAKTASGEWHLSVPRPAVTTPEMTTPTVTAPEQDTSAEAKKPSKKDKHGDDHAEPPVKAVPRAHCGPHDRPETGLQGEVTQADHDSGRAAQGFTCNTRLVGSHTEPNARGTVGGFRVERYVDASGNECAYYDTTLLFPSNIDALSGVNVLDMSDSHNPDLTETLITPAMETPHESLRVNKRRGLLAAETGNPAFYPGLLDIYDISQDCRHPVLRSSTPTAILGHESGWSPDGLTYYAGSAGGQTLVAIDVTNPSLPVTWWIGAYPSHGLEISDDGNRAYVASVTGGEKGLIILDTSEIQSRVVNPTVTEVSHLQWNSESIPQNAIPITIRGRPYLVEIDEFGALSQVGAGRIIDIKDEEHPFVVSNLRLEVHQPENFDAIKNDPGADNTAVGSYAGHYCNVPKRKDPGIVACSMILSGLRVFDIRDPHKPQEIAYFNAPISPNSTFPGPSNWAMSSPSFVPKRGEIWYSDGLTGFYAVKVTHGVWPFPKCDGKTANVPTTGKKTKGTKGDDVIVGRHGKDRINGKGGRDRICSGGGDDKVNGGPGDDEISGGQGRDDKHGGDGSDST
jgi:hemolysin type calcium-binding protein